MAWYWWVLAAFLVMAMYGLHLQAKAIWYSHDFGEGREAAFIPMAVIGFLFMLLLFVVL